MIEYEWTQELCESYTNNIRPMIKHDHFNWAAKIVKQINSSQENLKYLDIATGPGFLLVEVAKMLEKPVLFAHDGSKFMLNIAEKEAKNSGFEIQKFHSDAEKINIENNSMDIVTCKQLLHEVKSPEKIISEIYRVCKPDGKVFIVDFDKNSSSIGAKLIKTFVKVNTNKQIADNFWKSYKNGLDGKKVKQMTKDAGFSKVFYIKSGYNYFILAKK